MGSHQKKKKRTKDTRAVTSEIKRQQDLDANRLAIQPSFEGSSYAPRGVGLIEFCNVSTTIGPSQTIPPGLPFAPQNVVVERSPPAPDTQLNITWDQALANPTVTSHKGYRALDAAFTVGAVTWTTAMPALSRGEPGLTPGTTYYIRMSGVNSNGEGPVSTTVSMSTAGSSTGGQSVSLWLELNNSLADSSGNANTATFVPSGGNVIYGTPGKFGSHYAVFNHPNNATHDVLTVNTSTSTDLDLSSVGFSFSFWIYPTLSPPQTSILFYKGQSAADNLALCYLYFGDIMFKVKKSGTVYPRRQVGYTANVWQHIVCTFNAVSNATRIYLDKLESGTTTTDLGVFTSADLKLQIGDVSGDTSTGIDIPYNGRIDEFQYFKGIVLTQTQVNNLFNSNAP